MAQATETQINTMLKLLEDTESSIDQVLLEAVFMDLEDREIVGSLPAEWVQACITYLSEEQKAQEED
jgi:hypothetical protein